MMLSFVSGNDQFNLISETKIQTNSFQPLKEGLVFEDCILEWDLILFSHSENGSSCKTWFIKGIRTGQVPIRIFPPSEMLGSDVGATKAVIARKTVYILDQNRNKLYTVNLNELLSEDLSEHSVPTYLACSEVDFSDCDSNEIPTIIDISSSGQDCFAIDSQSGIYKVPKLLWRLEGLIFRSIHSGFSFNVIVSDTGAVYTWGNGSRGELGQRISTIECEAPKRVEFFDDLPCIVTSIVCGGWHSLALTSDGDIYSWGWNESGQLGHSKEKLSPISSDPYPIDLGSAEDPVVTMAAGVRHSFAVLKSGKVYSWGFNKFGQLGLGDNINHLLPTEVHFNNLKRNVKLQCGRWATLLHC